MKVPPAATPRLHGLDRLRGVCALSVFLSHWFLWNSPPAGAEMATQWWGGLMWVYKLIQAVTWPEGSQHPAVVCFFVLSGFCVHGGFENRARAGVAPSWRVYYQRRFNRIMPVYWVGALLGVLFVVAQQARPVDMPLLWFHAQSAPPEIVARLGAFAGLWPREIFAGNLTLGTVAVEILIYVGYPLFHVLIFRARHGWKLAGLIAVILYVLPLWLDAYLDPFVLYASILVGALLWTMGAGAAHWFYRRSARLRGRWVLGAWVGFIGLNQLPYFVGASLVKQVGWAGVCVAGILWLVGREREETETADSRLARNLNWWGRISYPLYAVHTPVILLVVWFWGGGATPVGFGLQAVLSLGLSVMIAHVVHDRVECRFYAGLR